MKKFLVIVSVLLLCILGTAGALILALRSARVQTAAVAILTDELSRALHVEAHIDQVDIRPPLSMHLQGVYMSDQHGDTLLSVPLIKVRFNPFALEQHALSFPLIQIVDPTIQVVQDSASSNIDFLTRAFPANSSDSAFTYAIDCRKIAVQNARIHYVHRPTDTDVLLTHVQTDLGFLYAGKDSLSATLRSLHVRAQLLPIKGYFEADLHGSLDTLFADQMQVVYHGKRLFSGNVQVNHLLSPDDLTIKASCTDLFANSAILTSLLGDLTHQPVQLPAVLDQLGNIHYRGEVDGSLRLARLHGAFRTHIGTVATNVVVKNLQTIEGRITTRNLDMARWLNNTDLGRLSASISVDVNLKDATGQLKGEVSRMEYKGYSYSALSMQGSLTADQCWAQVEINDSNLIMLLDAHLDDIRHAPTLAMDIQLNRMNLSQLHLTDSTYDQSLSFCSSIHLHTDTSVHNVVDGTVGTIRFDSVYMAGLGRELTIPVMDILISADSAKRHMHIQSPALTANIDGHFQWTTIPATIQRFIHYSLPSLVEQPVTYDYANDMDFSVQIIQINELINVLMPNELIFNAVPTLSGFVHESDSSFSIQMFSPEVTKRNTAYQNMVLSLDNTNQQRNATATFSIMQHIISEDSTRLRVGDMIAKLRLVAHDDSIATLIDFGPVEKVDEYPDIMFETSVQQMDNNHLIDVHIMPTAFEIGAEDWHIAEGHIQYTSVDSALTFDNVHFFTRHQMLKVHGRMSKSLQDSLQVQFRDVDLGYLLSATKVVDAIEFSGKMSGEGTLYGAFSTPQFDADVIMPEAQINGVDFGCIRAKADLDRENGEVKIVGSAVKDNVQIADVKGRVETTRSTYWEIDVAANGAPLGFINHWTPGLLEQIEGQAYGNVHIFGHHMKTWVTTRAYAKDAALTVPATGCRYFFSDSIIMDTAYIAFPNITIHDIEGHTGVLSGKLEHTCFTNFKYRINAQCRSLAAINLPSSAHSAYYGKAYADGSVDITGDEVLTKIDVNASTAPNTNFFLSLATASSATSSEFITFRQSKEQTIDTVALSIDYKPKATLLLNLAIEVKPTARIHLVLNEHTEDGIVGRGEGNIRLGLNASTGDMQMLGTYTLMNGTFSYTVGNLVRRDFTIAEGSNVNWSGDPANPQLDITAKYRCTASLRDLFGTDVKSVTSRSSIPVDCVLRISGMLNNMILKFGIEYPQSDESVAAQINSIINTEAMLMRQVIYLLVFNRFFTPEEMRTDNRSTGLNDAYSLLSSTVTGQINAWLSKLTSMVNVGFNMRTDGVEGNQSYETEANVQIQPIDRLTINGNVGYRYNDITNQPFFGDANVEYELTPDGKFRAKVFTHSVDKYSLHQSGMQEGVGFVFRHDFNPGDAKKRREQKP